METMRWQADASCSRSAAPRRRLVGRVLFSSCASSPTTRTRGSVGVKPCLAIVLAHVFLAIFGAWLQLNVDSSFRCIFEHSSACGNMVIFSPVPLSSSMSLPRIWLSRSTSKIDALDDEETPLRLTASQTATTRGVMASDIMGACDIAPSLHFVAPGLKLNAEEWIKVMDEYIVPNCTVLIEPGRKFLLISDNAVARQQACLCEHYSTVLHGTVEFQPPCSPDLSPLDFFLWNELKVQLVQHPAPANPAELWALLTRVYRRTWAGSRDVAAKGGFFE